MAKIVGNGLPTQGAGAQPKIDLSQAKDMNCIHCDNPYFIQAVMVKKISRFVTGTPNDAVLPVDVLLCGNCGQPLEDLLPKEFRKTPQVTPQEAPVEEKPASGLILEP
jgi:hypothetical protein